jgi:hypothetical protein
MPNSRLWFFKITVGIPTPSLNVLQGRWDRPKWKKKFEKFLKGYELLGLREKKKAVLLIERHGSRELDLDNYHGGAKVLIDLIKNKGLIVDDRPEWCEIIFAPQVKCKRGQEKTVVCIDYLQKEG